MPSRSIEQLATDINAMERGELIKLLRGLDCGFHLDFTDDFLREVSLERLRHIILAACLHSNASAAASS